MFAPTPVVDLTVTYPVREMLFRLTLPQLPELRQIVSPFAAELIADARLAPTDSVVVQDCAFAAPANRNSAASSALLIT